MEFLEFAKTRYSCRKFTDKQLFPEMEGYDIVGLFPIGYPAADEGGMPSKMHTQRKEKESITEVL